MIHTPQKFFMSSSQIRHIRQLACCGIFVREARRMLGILNAAEIAALLHAETSGASVAPMHGGQSG